MARSFFFSEIGTSKALSLRLSRFLSSHSLPFQLFDPSLYEPEDLPSESFIIAVASTWEDSRPPLNALFLSSWLSDSASDFRVGSFLLSSCKFAVFGVGSCSYDSNFNAVAKDFSRQMHALGVWRSCLFAKATLTEEILMRSSTSGVVLGGCVEKIFRRGNGQFLIGSRLESQRASEDESFGGSDEDDDANINESA